MAPAVQRCKSFPSSSLRVESSRPQVYVASQMDWTRYLPYRGGVEISISTRRRPWISAALDRGRRLRYGLGDKRRLPRRYGGAGLFALDGDTGAVKWFFPTNDSVSTTPAIDAATGDVYFGADFTDLGEADQAVFYAVDGQTGEEKWRFTGIACELPQFDPDNIYCTLSSPVADGERVYFGSGDETYFHRAGIPQTSRGDAAAATWTFRGDGSQ